MSKSNRRPLGDVLIDITRPRNGIVDADFEKMGVTDDDLKAIANALIHTNCEVQTLNLSGYGADNRNMIGPNVVKF